MTTSIVRSFLQCHSLEAGIVDNKAAHATACTRTRGGSFFARNPHHLTHFEPRKGHRHGKTKT